MYMYIYVCIYIGVYVCMCVCVCECVCMCVSTCLSLHVCMSNMCVCSLFPCVYAISSHRASKNHIVCVKSSVNFAPCCVTHKTRHF